MTALEQRAHLNLLAWFRLDAELTPDARIEQDDDAVFFYSGNRATFMNGAATVAGSADPEAFLARAEAFFGPLEAGYGVYTRDREEGEQELARLCRRSAYMPYPRYPQMVFRGSLREPAIDGVTLTAVETAEQAAAFWDICDRAYPSVGLPAGSFASFTGAVLLDPRVRAWVAISGGQPQACALGHIAERCTWVGWVAAIEAARGKGLGGLVTTRVVNDCREAGAEFASLQASPMGEPVYRRLGFEEIYNYKLWLKLPPDAGG